MRKDKEMRDEGGKESTSAIERGKKKDGGSPSSLSRPGSQIRLNSQLKALRTRAIW